MSLRNPIRILLIGLTLGLAFDLLFYGKLPGISILLFTSLLGIALIATLRAENTAVEWRNLWLLVFLFFFASMAFVRANAFLTFLNISAVLVIVALLSVSLVRKPIMEMGIGDYLFAPILASLMSFVHGSKIVRHIAEHSRRSARVRDSKLAAPLLRGLLLTVPVMLVFIPLLFSADLVFAEIVRGIFSLDTIKQAFHWGWRGVLIVAVGFIVSGGLAYTVWKQESGGDSEEASERDTSSPFALGAIEALVVVNAVNLLFLLFVLIQLPYLFGGQLNIDTAKFTYAEYARRGFAEMIVVAMLVLGLVLTLNALAHLASQAQRRLFNGSATVLAIFTTVILASAFKRLLLYEQAYGFTQLRIYPHVFMIWLGLLLIWFAITLWFRPNRFAIGFLIAAFGFIGTLNAMNPDAFIVQQNYARYQEQGDQAFFATEDGLDTRYSPVQIDAAYFTTLSDDAVPAMIEIVDELDEQRHDVVDEHLRKRYQEMQSDNEWRRWQAFHISRYRAFSLLQQQYDGIMTSEKP